MNISKVVHKLSININKIKFKCQYNHCENYKKMRIKIFL